MSLLREIDSDAEAMCGKSTAEVYAIQQRVRNYFSSALLKRLDERP